MHAKRFAMIMAVVVTLLVVIPTVSAQVRLAEVQYISIIDAYYGDLDGDGYEDDIKILVEFAFEDVTPTRVDLNMWVTLPSGLTWNFRISVFRAPGEAILKIDCIDMATESGWYTVTMLASIKGTGGGKIYLTDQLVFDPPTGGGSGLPPRVFATF